MAEGSSPTVLRRRLGIELRKLREAAAMKAEEVAERMEWSGTKLSRIETGRVRVHHGDVRDLLDLYGVTNPEQRDALITLAREGKRPGWWHIYGDVLPDWFEIYIGLESAAEKVWNYQGHLIPGLLQTEEYARAMFRAVGAYETDEEIERGVQFRTARQEALTRDNPLHVWAVLDEVAVRRPVGGPAVMREQLDHLVDASKRRNVEIQVLPTAIGAHAGMDNAFYILKFAAGDPDVVYLESLTSAQYLERQQDIERYTLVFDHLRAAALSTRDSVALITQIAGEL